MLYQHVSYDVNTYFVVSSTNRSKHNHTTHTHLKPCFIDITQFCYLAESISLRPLRDDSMTGSFVD